MGVRLRALVGPITGTALGAVVVAGAVWSTGAVSSGVGTGSSTGVRSGSPTVAQSGSPTVARAGAPVVAGSGSPTATGAPDGSGADAGSVREGNAMWVWPTGTRVVTRPWEAPSDDYAAGHRGIDVRAPVGAVAVAVAAGTVSFAGPVGGRSVVSIDHGHGLVSTLDSVLPSVSAGDDVDQGSPVGTVTVGHCPAAAPCVHLGARLDGRYTDPTPFLPAAEWPVLLPESAWPG